MRQRVVIVGGGVAGLSAAHELVERDFDVHVYERRPHDFGGKAASVRSRDVPASGAAAADSGGPVKPAEHGNSVPGEHGFRFCPGWYRHLPDTLKRIPYQGRRRHYEGGTVLDNLVPADVEQLSWYDRERLDVLAHPPRNMKQAVVALSVADRFANLGLAPGEVSFFVRKLIEFVTTPEAKRAERFDSVTWWQYLEADNKSQAFRDLIAATTRTMVAAKATEASAYSIASLAVRTLFDMFGTVDRVFNGPTNEVWIEPWVDYLSERGVTFHRGQELESIGFNGERKCISELRFSSLAQHNVNRLRWTLSLVESWWRAFQFPLLVAPEPDPYIPSMVAQALRASAQDMTNEVNELREEAKLAERLVATTLAGGPPDVDALPVDALPTAMRTAAEHLEMSCALAKELASDCVSSFVKPPNFKVMVDAINGKRKTAADALEKLRPSENWCARLERQFEAVLKRPENQSLTEKWAEGDDGQEDMTSYIFALPLEQMAYYVNRSPMLTHYDPSLRRLLLLAEHTDWMAGIQFYLKEAVEFTPGHLVCMDSEWGITAIEQTQHWKDVVLPSDIRAIISVDIANWDRKGRFNQKEAYNCTDAEIAEEVWQQLKASVNRDGKVVRLRDRMLRGPLGPTDPRSYHLDDSLVDILDRKKQGSYEKARSVRFSADALMRRQQKSGHESETPYVWGHRLRFNVEPLLINRVGTQALRPDVRTAIPNMLLASDYVRTSTDLACMESANEAARQAVNALLDATGSSKPRCQLWTFSTAKDLIDRLHTLARVRDRIADVAGAGRRVAEVMTGHAGSFAGELLTRWRGNDA